jgi:hypothetical protein
MQRIKGRGRRLHHPEKLTVASSFLVARHAEQRCGAARSDMLHCRHTDRSAFLAWPLISRPSYLAAIAPSALICWFLEVLSGKDQIGDRDGLRLRAQQMGQRASRGSTPLVGRARKRRH